MLRTTPSRSQASGAGGGQTDGPTLLEGAGDGGQDGALALARLLRLWPLHYLSFVVAVEAETLHGRGHGMVQGSPPKPCTVPTHPPSAAPFCPNDPCPLCTLRPISPPPSLAPTRHRTSVHAAPSISPKTCARIPPHPTISKPPHPGRAVGGPGGGRPLSIPSIPC